MAIMLQCDVTPTYLRAYLHFLAKIRDVEEPLTENEKNVGAEKQLGGEDNVGDANKENPVNEPEEKEPEDKVNCPIVQDVGYTGLACSPAYTFSPIGSQKIKKEKTISHTNGGSDFYCNHVKHSVLLILFAILGALAP